MQRVKQANTASYHFHQCGFGAGSKKPTRIDTFNCAPFGENRVCKTVAGKCSFSGRPHSRLSGLKDKEFVTSAASQYPRALAVELATLLVHSIRERRAHYWWGPLTSDPADQDLLVNSNVQRRATKHWSLLTGDPADQDTYGFG